jgi:sulfotransferase family protein
MPPPKVLYIAGWSRSGTTILEQVLGQVDAWFALGEFRHLFLNLVCGCGARVSECDFWRPILREALGGEPRAQLDAVAKLRRHKLDGDARALAAILGARRAGRETSPVWRYAKVLTNLYRAVAGATDARILVDSSKTASDAYLLATLTDIDLHVVHVVRDPRATAYSWRRLKRLDHRGGHLPTMGPITNSVGWLRRNAAIEAIVRRHQRDRYLRISYEDFAERPLAITREICSMVGEPEARPPLSATGTVSLLPNHTVAGNPVRFSHGDLRISLDDEWRSDIDSRSRAMATIPALPLMRRYGYTLRAGRPSQPPASSPVG